MKTPKKVIQDTAPNARPNSRGAQRRSLIFDSLHDCINRQGFVKTTLADIANGANMSPSHLLYYFKGKEVILEQYFEHISTEFITELVSFSEETLEQRIELLANFWFRDDGAILSDAGFMFECFGAAVNDDALHRTKTVFDLQCKKFLADLFAEAPSPFLNNSKDTAEISYSLMMGLRAAVYFDKDLSISDAHRLFRTSLIKMSGLD